MQKKVFSFFLFKQNGGTVHNKQQFAFTVCTMFTL